MAITTILAGTDLSPSSDGALERAIALAVHHKAKLVIVHAQADDAPIQHVDNDMLQQISDVSAAVRAEEARQLADRLAAIEALGVPTRLITKTGPPDEILAAAAVEHGAEVIVIGTHGHTGVSRFLLGSVASSTIRHATCDVLIVRGDAKRALYDKPLVATDFSGASSKAIAHTADLIVAAAKIDIVHAWQLPAGSWGATLLGQARFPWSTVRDAVLTSVRAQADKLLAEHPATRHPLHVELVQGPPASVITHTAEHGGYDLIAIGAHGRRGVRRLLLGSVAESTARHSPCSVLVVHGEG